MSTLLVDQETGELVEPALHAQNDALQKALTTATRKNTALQNEIAKLKAGDGDVPGQVQFAYGLWRELCRPKARQKPGPKRTEVLVKAIKRDGLETVLRAIRGAARYPYVVNGARCSTGQEKQRYDELELICRDEVKLESFERLAWRAAVEDGTIRPNRRPDQVRRLTMRYGAAEVHAVHDSPYSPIGDLAEWWAPCPLHNVTRMADAPMRIRWSPPASNDRMAEMVCAKYRCAPDEIWKAVDAL